MEQLPSQRAQVMNEIKMNGEGFNPQAKMTMPLTIWIAIQAANATLALYRSQHPKESACEIWLDVLLCSREIGSLGR